MDMEKTPVTILHEMMMKLGKTPMYELCQNKLETIPPMFTYKVTCDEVDAVGSGRSKKDAKQNAATAMLGKLRKGKVVPQSSTAQDESPLQIIKFLKTCTGTVPSSDSLLDNNSVQELMVLCSKFNLEEPVYKEMGTSGPDHARIYTVQCSISTINVTGTGKTKRQAKNSAAKSMADRVKGMFCTDSSSNGIESKKQKFSNFNGPPKSFNSENDAKEVSKLKINYDLKMESERKELNKTLKKLLPDLSQKLENLARLVKECQKNISEENINKVKQDFQILLQSAKIDFHHMLLQSMTSETFMLIIQLNTNPDILEMSIGSTREEAELRTINKVIETLKVFIV